MQKDGLACPSMREGQRARASSASEDDPRPWSKYGESGDHSSTQGLSSDDLEAEPVMKRSQRFSSSFSFGEDPESKSEDTEELTHKNPNGVTELVEADLAGTHVPLEEPDTSQRSGVFRPQDLWLAVTRCLSRRWPPCLSINRPSKQLALQMDVDQSADTQSSVSSEISNQSSSSSSSSDDSNVVKPEKEEVKSRGVKRGPPPLRWISRSSPRLPRDRQASDSLIASIMLEKEMFLWIELVDTGEERDDQRYRAEWRMSERTRELAEGVWLSRSQKTMT